MHRLLHNAFRLSDAIRSRASTRPSRPEQTETRRHGMTALKTRFALGLIFALSSTTGSATSVLPSPSNGAGANGSAVNGKAVSAAAGARHFPVPSDLESQISALGQAFDGEVGIAVQSIDESWETGWKDKGFYPQQSVSKLWVSITVLDALDEGRLRLDQPVTMTKDDLTLFHQPIAEDVLKTGTFTTTIDDLMRRAITTSDNSANDMLMRLAGGPAAVRSMIARKHLGAIRFANGERALQSRIAGVTWSQDDAIGTRFFDVRNALPMDVRSAAFNRYIEDPYDGAAPRAIVSALSRLKRGELLSPGSTAHLLGYMSNTHTGPNRLKGGLVPGWTLSHKTGTGQELDGVQAGYNDVGIPHRP